MLPKTVETKMLSMTRWWKWKKTMKAVCMIWNKRTRCCSRHFRRKTKQQLPPSRRTLPNGRQCTMSVSLKKTTLKKIFKIKGFSSMLLSNRSNGLKREKLKAKESVITWGKKFGRLRKSWKTGTKICKFMREELKICKNQMKSSSIESWN